MSHVRQAMLAVAASTAVLAAGWVWLRPRPTLRPVLPLVAARQWDAAEAQLRTLLEQDPANLPAHLLLATVVLERLDALPPPDDALARDALRHARRIPTNDQALGVRARIVEGKLCDRLARFDEEEVALKAAVDRDPACEAGWLLLGLYELEARRAEGRALAKRLYRSNPRPEDKRAALLELARADVHRPAAAGLIALLTRAVQANPGDFRARVALGRALAREGHESGLAMLHEAVVQRPADLAAHDALLGALEDAGQVEALRSALDQARSGGLPGDRFVGFEGWLCQELGQWDCAAAAYRRALQAEPYEPRTAYRLGRVLRLAGKLDEAQRVEEQVRVYDAARNALRSLYEHHELELRTGTASAETYQQVAGCRERMGCRDEAWGWHALVLRADPSNRISLAAVDRLK